MSQPHDPFALQFDSIEIDPTRAPARAAIERAMASVGPTAAPTAPGFYLLDDCGGRFSVDRDMGVVTLLDDALITTERNAVHDVRLKVIEPSGASYELDLKLRITGHVPQMVGAEDIDFLGTTAPVEIAPPHIAAPRRVVAIAPEPTAPRLTWTGYSVATHAGGKVSLASETAPYGAVLDRPPLPTAPGPFRLHLFTPLPQPSARDAAWSL